MKRGQSTETQIVKILKGSRRRPDGQRRVPVIDTGDR